MADSVVSWAILFVGMITSIWYFVKWALAEMERDKREITDFWQEQGWN